MLGLFYCVLRVIFIKTIEKRRKSDIIELFNKKIHLPQRICLMIKKFLALLLAVLSCVLCVSCGNAHEDSAHTSEIQYDFPSKENVVDDRQYYTGVEEVCFPSKLWGTPDFERAPRYDRRDQGVQAYFLQSVDYNDAPTFVFAFVGIPATATKESPVPGVVLVHGGGGTAFPDWVKMWNDRGYAAIAIDTEGNIPSANVGLSSVENVSFESVKPHGPSNTGYKDHAKPANEQYLYHAIAGAIVANSFLSSFEEVDGGRIGLTGISWGGVIATNTAAYDDRLAFVAPVYGAVAMTGTDRDFGTLYATYPRCSILWDDVEMLRNCRTPMLFVNWEEDAFFAVEGTKKCVNTAMHARMLLIAKLHHSHLHGANVEEIFRFADSVVRKG